MTCGTLSDLGHGLAAGATANVRARVPLCRGEHHLYQTTTCGIKDSCVPASVRPPCVRASVVVEGVGGVGLGFKVLGLGFRVLGFSV